MKNSKILKVGLALIVIAFVYSCSSGSKSSIDDNSTDDGGDIVTVISVAPLALVGSWQSPCTAVGPDSFIYGVVVEDGKVTRTTKSFFAVTACEGPGFAQTEVFTNSVQYGDEYILAIGGHDVYNIDGTSGTLTLTPENGDRVTYLNDNEICGHTDWTLGITKDLTNNCSGIGAEVVTVAESIADWYQIAGVVSTKLHIGDTDTDPDYDGTTAAKRPVALEISGKDKL